MTEPVQFLPVLLYIGPDVLMPIASALAAVAGILLMFWRRTVAIAQRIGRALRALVSRITGRRDTRDGSPPS